MGYKNRRRFSKNRRRFSKKRINKRNKTKLKGGSSSNNILEKELNNEINLITAFSKSEASSHMIKLAEEHDVNTNEFENGVVGYNKDFFNKFKGAKNN